MIKIVSEFLIIPIGTKPSEKIYFNQNPEISDNVLIGINIPFAPNSFFYENVIIQDWTATAMFGDYNPFFITLVNKKGEEVHKNLCLSTLMTSKRVNVTGLNLPQKEDYFLKFNNTIDLKKCYIQCSDSPYVAIPSQDEGILVNFIIKTK